MSLLSRPRSATVAGSALDGGITALILGLFSMMWFGWGQAGASVSVGAILNIGTLGALAVTVLAAILTFRNRHANRALRAPGAQRRYGIVVGVEFAVAGLGAVALGVVGASAYIPVWICAVVGLHFFPLATLFQAPALDALAVVVTAVAAIALLVGLLTAAPPGAVTGVGAGLAMLLFAILALTGRGRRPDPE